MLLLRGAKCILPSRLLKAVRLSTTPAWRIENSLDDEAARAVVRTCVLGGNGVFIDVGAHSGEILRAAVEANPEGRHHAFEPGSIARDLKSKYPNVKVHEFCVGDSNSQVDFFVYKRSTRSATRAVTGEDLIEVKQVRQVSLDQVIGDEERISVIKIDVEGAELEVLIGAARLLNVQAPVLLFEHGSPNGGVLRSTRALFEFLQSNYYRISPIRGGAVESLADFSRIVERGEAWNFLAVVGRREGLPPKSSNSLSRGLSEQQS